MRRTWIVVALLLAAGPALAEEPEERQPRPRRGAEILSAIDRPRPSEGWLEPHLGRLHADERGLLYRRSVGLGDGRIDLDLRGPALGRKRVGLEFQLHF